jgi:ABC-type multidrug transport system fused ATPase/permease subunit
MNNTFSSLPVKSLISFVWKFICLQPWAFFFIFLFSFAWSVESTVWPYLLRLIIDTLTLHESDRSSVWLPLQWPLIAAVCLWIGVEAAFRCRDFLRARALPKLEADIILDEATYSLDSVTEKYIQESLEKLMQNRTTIVIAHRLSTLSKMDRILVFDGGKVVEEGSHTALIAKKGYYAHLWNMQVGGFLPNKP